MADKGLGEEEGGCQRVTAVTMWDQETTSNQTENGKIENKQKRKRMVWTPEDRVSGDADDDDDDDVVDGGVGVYDGDNNTKC